MTGSGDGDPRGTPAEAPAGSRLEVRLFAGGPFQENGYILRCKRSGRAAVVDPGFAAPGMARAIEGERLDVEAVYLTHAHIDHVEGLPAIREVTDAPIHLHAADLGLYDRARDQAAAMGYTFRGELPPIDAELRAGTVVTVGETELRVRFAPGHAPGHVIFYQPEDGFALVGDVIFQRSIGRSDLPGGDFQELIASIRREVLSLPDETRLLPGHGPETTVGEERAGNPFLIPQFRDGFEGRGGMYA